MVFNSDDFYMVAVSDSVPIKEQDRLYDLFADLFNDPFFCHRHRPKWSFDFDYHEIEYSRCN
jgi:hypothetical protein